jgi:hypothetical protein
MPPLIGIKLREHIKSHVTDADCLSHTTAKLVVAFLPPSPAAQQAFLAQVASVNGSEVHKEEISGVEQLIRACQIDKGRVVPVFGDPSWFAVLAELLHPIRVRRRCITVLLSTAIDSVVCCDIDGRRLATP